jgi:hypothetical protein
VRKKKSADDDVMFTFMLLLLASRVLLPVKAGSLTFATPPPSNPKQHHTLSATQTSCLLLVALPLPEVNIKMAPSLTLSTSSADTLQRKTMSNSLPPLGSEEREAARSSPALKMMMIQTSEFAQMYMSLASSLLTDMSVISKASRRRSEIFLIDLLPSWYGNRNRNRSAHNRHCININNRRQLTVSTLRTRLLALRPSSESKS